MKNLLIILIALVVISPAFAGHGKLQGHKTMEEHAAGRLEYLSIVLDLTDAQITGIQELQSEHISTAKGIKNEYQSILDDMKAELKEIRIDNKDNKDTFEHSKEKAKEVREKYDPMLKPMRDALKEEKGTFNSVLVTILNAEQQEKYTALTAWKEKNKPEMKRHNKDHEGMHGPHKMQSPEKMHPYKENK